MKAGLAARAANGDELDDRAGELDHGMDRRTRICLWIIVLGMANFVAYTIGWMFIGGDAPMHGRVVTEPAGAGENITVRYMLNVEGRDMPVRRGTWIYSAVHSISVWPTVGAVMLSMLTLAKDRIVSSMRSSMLRGRTLMTILATLIGFVATIMTVWFVLHTIRQLAGAGGAA